MDFPGKIILEQFRAFFDLGPAPNDPSGAVRALRKDSRTIVTTQDITWLDMKDDQSGS